MKQFSTRWGKLMLGLLGGTLIANVLWVILNHAPLAWDSASHTWISLQILSFIRQFNFQGILIASNYYPVFLHTFTALFMLILGPHIILSQYFALLYYLATLYIIYLYTSTHFKSEKIGFITTAVFSFMPIVYDQAHWLMLDIPLTGMVFLCLYLFEQSESFVKKDKTLWFFVALAGLIMTKWTGVFFLVIPALFAFTKKGARKNLHKRIPTVLIGIAMTLALCLPWYLTNYQALANQASVSLSPDGSDPQRFLSLSNFTDYLYLFINFQAAPFLGIISIAAFVYLLIKRDKQGIFLASCITFGYLFFTCIGNKDPRYTIPLLPFAGMLIAYAWITLEKTRARIATTLGISMIVLLAVGSLFMSFRQPPLDNIRNTIPVPVIGSINVIDINDELVRKFDPHPWPQDSLFTILEDKVQENKAEMLVAFEDEHLNPSTLQTYLKSYQLQGQLPNFTIKTPDIYFMENTFQGDQFPDNTAIDSYLAETTYALVSPTDLGTKFLRNRDALEQVRYRIVADTLPRCDHFTAAVAPKGTTCYLDTGEVLHTGADVVRNDEPVTHGERDVKGYAKVQCPWGCSFGIVKPVSTDRPFTVTLLKHFTLPDGKVVNLYQINHTTHPTAAE